MRVRGKPIETKHDVHITTYNKQIKNPVHIVEKINIKRAQRVPSIEENIITIKIQINNFLNIYKLNCIRKKISSYVNKTNCFALVSQSR